MSIPVGRLISYLTTSWCNSILGTRSLNTTRPLAAHVIFKLSDIGEGIREVAVKEWYVKVGDAVKQFDKVCEVQSDKASVTITSRYDGTITKLFHKVNETALVGKPLLEIDTENDDLANEEKQDNSSQAPEPEKQHSFPPVESQSVVETKREFCIPSVRRLAKQHNIDLSQVKPSGKDGRILKEDILQYLNKSDDAIPTVAIKSGSEKITGFQKAMVKTMTESLKIPSFVYSDEMSLTKLSRVRREINKNMKMSYTPFFIKAVSNALTKFPILNAITDAHCENVTYRAMHNIGVAMDTKVGLAVPVIKNCQDLTIVQIERELKRLMAAGKLGIFDANDLSGGTFTISNIGAIGGTYTKPIILAPQVAILAIGKAKVLPRFNEEMQVIAEEIICLSAAADHRIVDGATMGHFVNQFKRQIEDPNLLFLNL